MSNWKFRVAAIATVSVAAIAVPASARHAWSNYHWAITTSRSLSLEVVKANTSEWETAVNQAISDWNTPVVTGAPDVLTLSSSTGSSVDRSTCSPITGKVLVCNDAYGSTGWLGIATIWLDDSNHITAGTTQLNDTYYSAGGRYDTPAWRRFVTCQEIGHDFGLAHQDEAFYNPNKGSCMDYTNDPDGGGKYGPSNERPNKHDYEQLDKMYAHADGYGTSASQQKTNFGIREVGKSAPAGVPSLPAAGKGPASWGQPVHFDSLGRPDVFAKELSGGYKMVTHVFWTLEERPRGHSN